MMRPFDGARTRRWALVLVATVLATASFVPPAGADTRVVRDPDPYESYFLGARAAAFHNSPRTVGVRVDHHELRWSSVDTVRLTLLVGRMTRDYAPPYATGYTVLWERGRGTRLERQSPGQEYPDRVRCRDIRLRHSADPARVVITVPTRCLPVPRASRPGLADGGGNDVQFSYVIHDSGGNVTETVPGTSSQGDLPDGFTRWLDRG